MVSTAWQNHFRSLPIFHVLYSALIHASTLLTVQAKCDQKKICRLLLLAQQMRPTPPIDVASVQHFA
jgi:hypothetical protein